MSESKLQTKIHAAFAWIYSQVNCSPPPPKKTQCILRAFYVVDFFRKIYETCYVSVYQKELCLTSKVHALHSKNYRMVNPVQATPEAFGGWSVGRRSITYIVVLSCDLAGSDIVSPPPSCSRNSPDLYGKEHRDWKTS